jgi:putative effector of murein hydrolase
MSTSVALPIQVRLGWGWFVPVLAYWAFLYIASRHADPMAFPVFFSAALVVPILNAWVLLPKFKARASALGAGIAVPVLAAVFLVAW